MYRTNRFRFLFRKSVSDRFHPYFLLMLVFKRWMLQRTVVYQAILSSLVCNIRISKRQLRSGWQYRGHPIHARSSTYGDTAYKYHQDRSEIHAYINTSVEIGIDLNHTPAGVLTSGPLRTEERSEDITFTRWRMDRFTSKTPKDNQHANVTKNRLVFR
jgi:hypothetical protein